MNDEQLVADAHRLMSAFDVDLTCDEAGHPDGHACLAISETTDLDSLVRTFSRRNGASWADIPDLPFGDWTHAWVRFRRMVLLGRAPSGRPLMAVTERNLPSPDELPPEPSWLERLVAITGGAPSPVPAPDWTAIESRLGVPVPSDYKRLVETFGCDGMFDLFFRVFDPDELILNADDGSSLDDEHPPFPAPGSLLPWSNNEHQEWFFWITEGRDPDRWPLYAIDSLGAGSRFECTATEFLFRQMTDPDHPFFSQADHVRGHWFLKYVRPET
ncbi:hypothetical protein [Spirillospora sp. NPDC047279]|uniref:hypothetical protein n=1 Tax=Spirillospora sp. NPDC047279 TaxID=3155478 RepID=UPI0033C629DF